MTVVVLVIGIALIFGLLRLLSGLPLPASQSDIFTSKVVVVGVTGRYQPDATDRKIISAHSQDVQAGAISTRPGIQGECAAAGWLTIGAGRRTTAGGLCTPTVTRHGSTATVDRWQRRLAASTAHQGDAVLGTLAKQSPRCIGAVGPGAALAAADPNGTVDHYRTAEAFTADKYRLDCPVTLVDAGASSDRVITALADRDDVTLVVTGVGPTAGTHDDNLQLIYRLGTTMPGLMTSETTRRKGIVTLIDLTRTILGFSAQGKGIPADAPLDGTKITVQQQPVSAQGISNHLRTIANLSGVAPTGYVVGGVIGVILAAGVALGLVRRWWPIATVGIAGLGTLTAALMLTGSIPWAAAGHPTAALLITLCCWVAALTAGTIGLARLLRLPIPIVAAILTMATFTTDAALGGVMQPGSLLNSRPVAGGRWYGFGNSTFGSYAVATVVVAGSAAHLLGRAASAGRVARRWLPPVAVLAIGGLAVVCEGWPSMGADFGGVISLTPTVLFLALAVSGWRITWRRLALIGCAAVVAVGVVSVLDWMRGQGQRSHLGDFVQRVISGDAWPIIFRKAVASGSTLIAPLGIIGIVVGLAVWLAIFRRLHHAIPDDEFSTFRATAITACATGIIGTLLNDAGISVFLTVTGPFAVTVVGLLHLRYRRYGWAAIVRGEYFADRPTGAFAADHDAPWLSGHDDTATSAPEVHSRKDGRSRDRRPRDPRRSGNPAVRGRSRRR